MRKLVNGYWEVIKNFEAFDWLIVFIIVVVWLIIPYLISTVENVVELFMKKVFKMKRCTYIKGWKKIK